jgi:hypothetical protein
MAPGLRQEIKMANEVYSMGGFGHRIDGQSVIVTQGAWDGQEYRPARTWGVDVREGHRSLTPKRVAELLVSALRSRMCRGESIDLRAECRALERADDAAPGYWLTPVATPSAEMS